MGFEDGLEPSLPLLRLLLAFTRPPTTWSGHAVCPTAFAPYRRLAEQSHPRPRLFVILVVLGSAARRSLKVGIPWSILFIITYVLRPTRNDAEFVRLRPLSAGALLLS